MNTYQTVSLFLLRISMGWLMFYAGITKILDPSWTSKGYIGAAKTFPEFFSLFLDPKILPLVDLANEWGLTLIGASLILGLFVRWSAILGAVLMLLYYFPILDFPYPNIHSYIVDDHLIYFVVFLILSAFNAGKYWSLSRRFG